MFEYHLKQSHIHKIPRYRSRASENKISSNANRRKWTSNNSSEVRHAQHCSTNCNLQRFYLFCTGPVSTPDSTDTSLDTRPEESTVLITRPPPSAGKRCYVCRLLLTPLSRSNAQHRADGILLRYNEATHSHNRWPVLKMIASSTDMCHLVGADGRAIWRSACLSLRWNGRPALNFTGLRFVYIEHRPKQYCYYKIVWLGCAFIRVTCYQRNAEWCNIT